MKLLNERRSREKGVDLAGREQVRIVGDFVGGPLDVPFRLQADMRGLPEGLLLPPDDAP